MTDAVPINGTSARFGIPFLYPGQAQKEFLVNQGISITDLLIHCCVIGEVAEPPITPGEGDSYLVGPLGVGSWESKTGYLASYQSGVWITVPPQTGMRVFDKSTHQIIHYNDEWIRPATPSLPDSGATQDTELRQAFTDLIETLKDASILAVT